MEDDSDWLRRKLAELEYTQPSFARRMIELDRHVATLLAMTVEGRRQPQPIRL